VRLPLARVTWLLLLLLLILRRRLLLMLLLLVMLLGSLFFPLEGQGESIV